MANNKLILRNLESPWNSNPNIINDITLNKVLSFDDLDNNLIYLKGGVIYSATTNLQTVTLHNIRGDEFSFSIASSSADTYVISGTYNPITESITLLRNDSGTVVITGITSGSTSGSTDDTYVTGGTYVSSASTIDLYRNDGGIISITGFTGGSISGDTYITGGTFTNETLTLNINDGDSIIINGFQWTGNTSATCISDIYVSTIHACSPLTITGDTIQLLTTSGVTFGSSNGYTFPLTGGTSGQTFVTDGLGNIVWSTPSGITADTYVTGASYVSSASTIDLYRNDGNIVSITGVTSSVSNGLTGTTDNTFKLGGILTENTNIETNNSSFELGGDINTDFSGGLQITDNLFEVGAIGSFLISSKDDNVGLIANGDISPLNIGLSGEPNILLAYLADAGGGSFSLLNREEIRHVITGGDTGALVFGITSDDESTFGIGLEAGNLASSQTNYIVNNVSGQSSYVVYQEALSGSTSGQWKLKGSLQSDLTFVVETDATILANQPFIQNMVIASDILAAPTIEWSISWDSGVTEYDVKLDPNGLWIGNSETSTDYYILPLTKGTENQYLALDGFNDLQWVSPSTGFTGTITAGTAFNVVNGLITSLV